MLARTRGPVASDNQRLRTTEDLSPPRGGLFHRVAAWAASLPLSLSLLATGAPPSPAAARSASELLNRAGAVSMAAASPSVTLLRIGGTRSPKEMPPLRIPEVPPAGQESAAKAETPAPAATEPAAKPSDASPIVAAVADTPDEGPAAQAAETAPAGTGAAEAAKTQQGGAPKAAESARPTPVAAGSSAPKAQATRPDVVKKPAAATTVADAPAAPEPVAKAPAEARPAARTPAPPKPVAQAPAAAEPVTKAKAKAPATPRATAKAPAKAKPVAQAPAKPKLVASPKPVAKAPAKPKPVAKAPAKPVAKAPAKPKPVAKAPAKPIAKAPAKPKPAAKAPAKLASRGGSGIAVTIERAILAAAKEFGVDPALVRAVVRAESGFNPRSLSSVGAMGLMQLMPSTAKALGVKDPWDPVQNIRGGTRFLSWLLQKFGNVKHAVAAYNAGPGAVSRYGGIPPYRETQGYVKKVLNYFKRGG